MVLWLWLLVVSTQRNVEELIKADELTKQMISPAPNYIKKER